jgi:putative tricarboxylic transport membrane protein
MEQNLRKSLILSQGDCSIFFTRPVAAVSLIAYIAPLFLPMVGWIGKKRVGIPKEETS